MSFTKIPRTINTIAAKIVMRFTMSSCHPFENPLAIPNARAKRPATTKTILRTKF